MNHLSDDQEEKAEKILKLLTLAEDDAATANEAEVAQKKAEALMQKHSLTRKELQAAQYELVRWEMPEYTRAPGWYRTIMGGLKDFLGVFSLYYPGTRTRGDENAYLRIAGKERDIEMFKYMLVSIKEQVHQLCADWKDEYEERTGDRPSRKDSYAFRSACARRVRKRLKSLVQSVQDTGASSKGAEETPNDQALTLAEVNTEKQEAAKDVMREAGYSWHSTQSSSYKRGAGSRAGRRAGNNVSVSKPAKRSGGRKQITARNQTEKHL